MNTESTIIVPWDFSNHSKAALKYAFQHFPSNGIRVICVLEPPNPYATGIDWGPQQEQKAIDSCVEDFYKVAEHAYGTGLQFFAEFGEPADQIIRLAKKLDAGLIVISTHGRTGLQRLFMGSVAQKVTSKSTCPIIMLPSKWCEAEKAEQKEKLNTV